MNLSEECLKNKYQWHIGPIQIGYNYGVHLEVKARKAITIKDVIGQVCLQCHRTKSALLGRDRSYEQAHPRQLAMLLIRELCPNLSAPAIGRVFNRDHSTILHGIKQARERVQWDDDYRDAYNAVRNALGVPVAPSEQVRACMFCGENFLSSGPGNRLCNDENCKERRKTVDSGLGA